MSVCVYGHFWEIHFCISSHTLAEQKEMQRHVSARFAHASFYVKWTEHDWPSWNHLHMTRLMRLTAGVESWHNCLFSLPAQYFHMCLSSQTRFHHLTCTGNEPPRWTTNTTDRRTLSKNSGNCRYFAYTHCSCISYSHKQIEKPYKKGVLRCSVVYIFNKFARIH